MYDGNDYFFRNYIILDSEELSETPEIKEYFMGIMLQIRTLFKHELMLRICCKNMWILIWSKVGIVSNKKLP